MNITFALLLFFSALIPGAMVIIAKKSFQFNSTYFLVFAGSYIFSITIVHLLPELFSETRHPEKMGLFVLLGFFIQIFIDFLTSGVEHGHSHISKTGHTNLSPALLMIGLTIHAIMDGSILAHPGSEDTAHALHQSGGLLFGIIIHKIPASVVLMLILQWSIQKKQLLLALLLIFSLASPFGLWAGNFLGKSEYFGNESFLIIMALVSGNFLHISTSIFFESSPDHHFNRKKILIGIAGALLAVITEFLHF